MPKYFCNKYTLRAHYQKYHVKILLDFSWIFEQKSWFGGFPKIHLAFLNMEWRCPSLPICPCNEEDVVRSVAQKAALTFGLHQKTLKFLCAIHLIECAASISRKMQIYTRFLLVPTWSRLWSCFESFHLIEHFKIHTASGQIWANTENIIFTSILTVYFNLFR